MSVTTLEMFRIQEVNDEYEGRYEKGDSLDEFVIERLISGNRMSETYDARGPGNSHVAIKIFYTAGHNGALESYGNEVNVRFMLKHVNVLEFLKSGPGDNQFYLVMPFCEAGTLADWLKSRPFILAEDAHAIILQIASVFACTHSLGIIHGDLKLENILVSSTTPLTIKISDWASATFTSCPRLHVRKPRGTPEYAAPEQLHFNEPPSRESDMFSAGVVMAEAITGIRLFHVEGRSYPVRRNEPDLRLVKALMPQVHGTIESLLSPIAGDRPTAQTVLNVVESFVKQTFQPARERQVTK
jgi:serine/threonine protein kinase